MARNQITSLAKATACDNCEYAAMPHKLIRYVAVKQDTFEVIEQVVLCDQCRFLFLKRIFDNETTRGYADNYSRLLLQFHGIILTPRMAEFPGWQILKKGLVSGVDVDKLDESEV